PPKGSPPARSYRSCRGPGAKRRLELPHCVMPIASAADRGTERGGMNHHDALIARCRVAAPDHAFVSRHRLLADLHLHSSNWMLALSTEKLKDRCAGGCHSSFLALMSLGHTYPHGAKPIIRITNTLFIMRSQWDRPKEPFTTFVSVHFLLARTACAFRV